MLNLDRAFDMVVRGGSPDVVLHHLVEGTADLLKTDRLHGGRADHPEGKFLNWLNSPEGEAKLRQGMKHESEHTSDEGEQAEIAADHLKEDPNYYEKIAAIEKREKKGEKRAGTDSPRREN